MITEQIDDIYGKMGGDPEEFTDNLITTKLEAIKNRMPEHSFSGSYNDLTDKPFIPSKTSDLVNDSNYATNDSVAAEVAKIVADAPEDFDTLKEMSDWIASHEDSAAAMNSAIKDNADNIEAIEDTLPTLATESEVEQLAYDEQSGSGNIWDEIWEFGDLGASGEEIVNPLVIRAKNYTKVKPNTTYYFCNELSVDSYVLLFDINKAFISYSSNVKNSTFTTSSNCEYIRFYFKQSTPYTSGVAIIEGTSGTYKPYIPSVKMLADKCNETDTLKMLGYTVPEEMPIQNYTSNGVFHQRIGRVDISKVAWEREDDHTFYIYNMDFVEKAKSETKGTKAYCYNMTNYRDLDVGWSDWLSSTSINSFMINSTNISPNHVCMIKTSTAYSTASAFRNANKGKYLYYELANEVVTAVDGNENTSDFSGKPHTTWSAFDGTKFEVDRIPYNNAPITVVTRNSADGSLYILFWNRNEKCFYVEKVLSGNAPSSGNVICIQYLAE